MRLLDKSEKNEYEQFINFHVDMRKIEIKNMKPPKGFDKW